MDRIDYPPELLVELGLNEFGVPCEILRIEDGGGKSLLDKLSANERAALASGVDKVSLGAAMYKIGMKPKATHAGPILQIMYEKAGWD